MLLNTTNQDHIRRDILSLGRNETWKGEGPVARSHPTQEIEPHFLGRLFAHLLTQDLSISFAVPSKYLHLSKFKISAKKLKLKNILTINMYKLERNLTYTHNYQMKVCKFHNNVIFLQIVGQPLRYYEQIGLITEIVARMCTIGAPIGIDNVLCSFKHSFCHVHFFYWMCTCCVN